MRRWWLLLLLLAGVFAGLRGVSALADVPAVVTRPAAPVVVVGVTDRAQLDGVDRLALESHLDSAQVAMVSIRARYVGDCAAAGWTTLGAGRRAAVGGLCDPQVVDGRVADWPARVASAAARNGDARLGTLQDSATGCIGSVGPGAALAAADGRGGLADHRTVEAFLADGLSTSCPVTLVDAGDSSDAVISELAGRSDVTLVVTGIGPPPGSTDPSLQVVYRLGSTLPGWLTSASTRRTGIVTLTDLTRTLIEADRSAGGSIPPGVDGAPLAVDEATLTLPGIEERVRSVTALSDAAVTGYLSLAVSGSLLFAVIVAGIALRRFAAPQAVLVFGTGLLAAMMLTGAVPWARSPQPGLTAALAVHLWAVALTAAALALGRRIPAPAPVVAAALSVAVFTVDAALGGPMQPGSLINSRPIYGLRWYGFGNVTFAGYAAAGLLSSGYLASRLLDQGRRRLATAVVAVVGFGIVICEGWPSMGSDFGGVIALTPAVVGLVLVLSGVRLTALRLLAVGGSAAVAVGAISLLDFARGPDRRSHLGNFVQRVLDGDAADVVVRKAVASAETILSPVGIGTVLLGVVAWYVILRFAVPRLQADFRTVRPVLLACLATGVLGTLLNDGGIFVFLTITGWVSAVVLWFVLDAVPRGGGTQTGGTQAGGSEPRR